MTTRTVEIQKGIQMPIYGIGTYSLHGDRCISSVLEALKNGVRLIDTAHIYGNEREVGEAVGLRSSSTVSRYIHRLVDEGRITIDESKPRTLTAASGDALETVRQRVCLEMADGGKIYMDCNLEKPRTAPVRVSFEGVLDAKRMKSRVGRIVRCRPSDE